MKISEAIQYFEAANRGVLSQATLAFYRERLAHLVNHLNDCDIEAITIHELRAFRAALFDVEIQNGKGEARKISTATVFGTVKAAKRFFNWLSDEGMIEHNPATRLKLPQLPDLPRKGITEENREAMIDAASDPRDLALVLFVADTACRVGGLVNLTLADLDLPGRRALVREKGLGGYGKGRQVFFGEATAQALTDWLEARLDYAKTGIQAVFISYGMKGRTGEAIGREGVYEIFRRLARKAGVNEGWNPHNWRHGAARGMLQNGASLAHVQQILGHRNITTTAKFYASFSQDELAQAHERFSWLKDRQPRAGR